MLAHPDCQAAGGGGLIIPESAGQSTDVGTCGIEVADVAKVAMQPCHPWLVSWSMLFSCTLTHSAVMLRRSKLPSTTMEGPSGAEVPVEGGAYYDPKAFPAE
jgi:hypothetical protein